MKSLITKILIKIITLVIVIFLTCGLLQSQVIKRVLLEQHTGAWCGWCVDGTVKMNEILAKYPNNVIGVKIHNSDNMAIAEQGQIAQALGLTGYPNGSVDRKMFHVGVDSVIFLSRTDWMQGCETVLATQPIVGVNVIYTINESTRELSATISADFVQAVTGDIRFNIYICEDNVSGIGTGWDQANYLSGRAGYENNPYYTQPNPIVGYHHMKVVRAMLGGAWGTQGSISSPVPAGRKNSFGYTFTIPADWNINNIWVVGLVQMYDANPLYCTIFNSCLGVQGTPYYLTLTRPNGGERFKVGTKEDITWDCPDTTDILRIDYSTDNGIHWINFANNILIENKKFSWLIPNTPSKNCLIRIKSQYLDTTMKDQSDAVFEIYKDDATITVTSPNDGENFKVGSSQNITWDYTGIIDSVKIEFSDGLYWQHVNTVFAANRTYSWLVPNKPSGKCRIRISDASNSSINDVSDNNFSIIDIQNKSFIVPSDGTIVYYQTDKDKCYKIVVEGVYSMYDYGSIDSCIGVDAAYMYKLPPENVFTDNKWQTGLQYPYYLSYPVKVNLNNYYEIDYNKYIGFRIDDQPIGKQTLYQEYTHRYELLKYKPNNPFKFQILDSIKNITQNRVLPQYSDNCGYLTVNIEEITCPNDTTPPPPQICATDIIYDSTTKPPTPRGIRLKAALWQNDPLSITGKSNILRTLSESKDYLKLGIVLDAHFVVPVDSIVCTDLIDSVNYTIGTGILIDKSGSMSDYISPQNMVVRLDAAKNAVKNFINNIRQNDKAFIMSFDDSTYLNEDWSSDKIKLKNSVDNLNYGGGTSVFEAIVNAIEKVDSSNTNKKSLIVLSDGGDNDTTNAFRDTDILNIVQRKNIPIYIIALGYSNDPWDLYGLRTMDSIANASRGRLFSADNANALDSIYLELANELKKDDCCGIYFHSNNICDSNVNNEHYIRLIYASKDTIIVTLVINYKCKYPVDIPEDYEEFENDASIVPNPFSELATLTFNVEKPGESQIIISDLIGNIVKTINYNCPQPGEYRAQIVGTGLSAGSYFVTVRFKGFAITRKVILLR